MQVKLLLVKIFTWMADCIIACSFGFPQIPKFRHTRILTWTVGRVLAYEVWPSLSQTHQRVRAPMQQNLLSVQNFHHGVFCIFSGYSGFRSSPHMRVINHNWSATKQHLHLQSVAEISRHSVFVRGQDSTMWDIVWVSPQGHRSVSVSRHFLLQAPQCPCSVQKRFSRDHCCRGRLKLPDCGVTLGEKWPPEPTSSYASIDLWCQLVANLVTMASWMSWLHQFSM